MRLASTLSLILVCGAAFAQGPRPKAVPSADAQAARQAFQQVLDSVDGAWFGKAYQDCNAVDIRGRMDLTLSAAAINAKASQVSQGQLRGIASKGGKAALQLQGTYFANGDFRTETAGDFGHMVYTRVGRRGFIYSKEQNAYTTAVDLPTGDAPLSYMGWFRSVILDIKAAYVDASTFKPSLGKEENLNGRTLQTAVFFAPSGAYDPAKREQNLKETFGFWKRGRMEIAYDKATHLPYRMSFSNEGQGVHTTMTFNYQGNGKLASVAIANRSKGMEGPGHLQVAYGGDGLMNHIAGELSGKSVKWNFDLGLSWAKGRKSSSIHSAPPAGANKKGGDEFQTALLVGVASQVFDLQRNGLNLMAPKISASK
ncbi:hypothetical protein [Holophaga foetida]|uniref:hypothetical protein n=1 Tax=Holophaga foetida TaxID=35839 RepID=UPI0002472100|nr:hypothetical protein [Holophaga foetida]